VADANRYVAQTRGKIEALLNALEDLEGAMAQYNAIGGGDFIKKHFFDEQGQDRADLDITASEFMDAVSSIQAIQGLMDAGHATNLYRAKP
jgi:hypothetical protein